MPGHRPGVPGAPGRPAGFQKFYVIFLMCLLCSLNFVKQTLHVKEVNDISFRRGWKSFKCWEIVLACHGLRGKELQVVGCHSET